MLERYRIEPFLLANTMLLQHLERTAPQCGNIAMDSQTMRVLVFHAFASGQYNTPDHIFNNLWEDFCNRQCENGSWVLTALDGLTTQFLERHGSKIIVKNGRFADWQKILTTISYLPVKGAFLARDKEYAQIACESLTETPVLPSVYDPVVEDYIADSGLYDTHLHLNGSSPAEYSWLKVLNSPLAAIKNLCAGVFNNTSQRKELITTIDANLTPALFLQRLRIAQQLRNEIWSFLFLHNQGINTNVSRDIYQIAPVQWMYSNCDLMRGCVSPFHNYSCFGVSRPKMGEYYRLELSWQTKLLSYLHCNPSPILEHYFLLYLLIKHQFMAFLVQRENYVGFDEFQKVTSSQILDYCDDNYLERFCYLHSNDMNTRSCLRHIEGRFSPAATESENIMKLHQIFSDYWRYLNLGNVTHGNVLGTENHSGLQDIVDKIQARQKCTHTDGKYTLSLVAHFIKKKSNYKSCNYYFEDQRTSIKNKALSLTSLLEKLPDLKKWICGIDAAANELDAPPEIFAPSFRYLRRCGISHVTYHAGEDYLHLISGIRAVDDVLELLEYRPYDRIGHGVSLGIAPQLWLDSMPSEIRMRRGEWLLNLLSLSSHSKALGKYCIAERAASEAVELGCKIFDSSLSFEELNMIMNLRGLEPKYVFDALDKPAWNWHSAELNDFWRLEAKLVAESFEKYGTTYMKRLADYWRNVTVRERINKLISVPKDYCNADELIAYQQSILKKIQDKRVLIEIPITSNLRISQYTHIKQHHIFRWMKIGAATVPGDPKVMLTLGSDDPGIFATDMKCEFYHLYEVLRDEFKLSASEAMQKLKEINECSRIYSFRN